MTITARLKSPRADQRLQAKREAAMLERLRAELKMESTDSLVAEGRNEEGGVMLDYIAFLLVAYGPSACTDPYTTFGRWCLSRAGRHASKDE